MEFQFEPGSSSMFARNAGTGVEERGGGEETWAYGGRGAGGKLRPPRKSSLKKTTPYDRPVSGRHSTAGGLPASSVSAHSSSSLASRLVGSASRLIASSASYFFPSLFSQKNLTLTNGNPAPVQGSVIDEQGEEKELDPVLTQETEHGPHQSKRDTANSEQDLAIVAVGAGSEKKDLDLTQVEDMLKQKTWSREQVSRLTDLLNTRLVDHPPTISHLAEAGVQAGDAAFRAVDVSPRRAEENASTPISEAQRWREELKRARTDCAPIEVARAYMGERTSTQSGLARSFRGAAHQIDRVAELQPPPGLGLAEDRYRSFPVLRSWSRSPATQVPKRSSFLDEDWMSVGPVRRTRQKTFHMNSSPYARGLPAGNSVPPWTHVSPPVQSSQTARKILDTLEMLSPSPKSRLLNDEPLGALDAPMSLTPDIFNLQGRRNLHRSEVSKFSSLRPSNGKLEFGSPSHYPMSTVGVNKESNFEDKSLVNRLLSNNEADLSNVRSGVSPKGISSTMSFLCSTAAYASLAPLSATAIPTSASPTTVATSASSQPERKPLFSFSFPSSVAGSQHQVGSATLGLPVTMPALSTFTTMPAVPALLTTSSSSVLSIAATSKLLPAEEQHSGKKGAANKDKVKGLDATVEEANRVSKEQGLTSFHFGSAPSLAPFSFKVGTDDFAAGGQSKSPFSSPFSSSKTNIFDSSPINPAVSTAPILFGSQSGTFPSFKPSTPGQLFSTSSIAKPTTIHSLTIEPSSAPFTFSPPPAPVSCATPTFCFGSSSSAGQVSVSCSITVSAEASPLFSAQDPTTGPVFTFTSPSGGPKMPIVPAENVGKDTTLPAPKFTFGREASPPSAELSAGSAPLMVSSGSGVGSAPLPSPFTFGGQTASGQVFGSGAGSALAPSSLAFGGQIATPTGLEPPTGFTSGATGSEKTGRKFLKAKRRK